MAELWQFYDAFACKICYAEYTTTQLPMSVCSNHHIICKPCYDTMKQTQNNRCPFCKVWMNQYEVKQDKRFLQIKEVVKKAKTKEEKYYNDLNVAKAQIKRLRKKCKNGQWVMKQYILLIQKLKKKSEQAKEYQQIAEENSKVWKLYKQSQQRVKELTENLQIPSFSDVEMRLKRQIEENKDLKKKNQVLKSNLEKMRFAVENNMIEARQQILSQKHNTNKRYVSQSKDSKNDIAIKSSKCKSKRSKEISQYKIVDLHKIQYDNNQEETTLGILKKLVHMTKNRSLTAQLK